MKALCSDFFELKNTIKKGGCSELIACVFLLAKGFEVFRNVTSNGIIDIVAFDGRSLIPIDVKSASMKNGNFYPNRSAQERLKKIGGHIVYVFSDSSCKFDYEVDEFYYSPSSKKNNQNIVKIARECPSCRKLFDSSSSKNKFCSPTCRPSFYSHSPRKKKQKKPPIKLK